MPEMRAVRFDRYGDIEELDVRRVPKPTAEPGRVVVQVKAAGINPGEAAIRTGALHDRWPATFPSGEGTDFAGVVVEVGDGVSTVKRGDEVLGFSHERSSHAEYVSVPAGQVTPKPTSVPWDVAGALFVAGTTAYAAVRAVAVSAGDTVAISGAAGGVGAIGVQLAKRTGATVLGIASAANDSWLAAHGAVPVNYGDGLAARLDAAAPNGRVDAFLDFFGNGYVELAVERLHVKPSRVDTIIDFAAAERFGAQTVGGMAAANVGVLAELAALVEKGELDVPIAGTYALDDVRSAFRDLEMRHTRGKIVLRP